MSETELLILSDPFPRNKVCLLHPGCFCGMHFLHPGRLYCSFPTLAFRRERGTSRIFYFCSCSFVPPVFQAGGSLAGKDSMDASSTMSSTSSCGGGASRSFGVDSLSWGCSAITVPHSTAARIRSDTRNTAASSPAARSSGYASLLRKRHPAAVQSTRSTAGASLSCLYDFSRADA
jgi:hypothetical protein